MFSHGERPVREDTQTSLFACASLNDDSAETSRSGRRRSIDVGVDFNKHGDVSQEDMETCARNRSGTGEWGGGEWERGQGGDVATPPEACRRQDGGATLLIAPGDTSLSPSRHGYFLVTARSRQS